MVANSFSYIRTYIAKFDAKAAFQMFEQEYEGLMYGYWTMLWGWLDMRNNDNLPPPLDIHLIASLFSIGILRVNT